MVKSDAPETVIDEDIEDDFEDEEDFTPGAQFVFGEYTGTDKPGKYDAEVEALIALGEDWPEEKVAKGIRPTITLNFPLTQKNKEGVVKDVVAKYRRYFQESAKSHDRTAREVAYVENGDNSVNVTFVLTDKITRPRKPKPDTDEASSDTAAETVSA